MGGKSQPQMPPPIDNSVTEAADKAEAKLAKEKTAMIWAQNNVFLTKRKQ